MSTAATSVDIVALTAATAELVTHGSTRRDEGYKGCDCDSCEATRLLIVESMPEVLRRLSVAEATVASLVAPPFGAPLQLGDRFQRRTAIYTVVNGADYGFNGHALLDLDAIHAPFTSRTWSGWGWSLMGLAADIINDGTALKRLPRLPVAPTA